MTVENDLLRMLEPVVRPDGVSGRTRAPAEPLDSRSFDSFLQEARTLDLSGATEVDDGAAKASRPDMLGQLGQIDRIANPSLLRLMGGSAE